MVILVKGWILPICGAASGRVCDRPERYGQPALRARTVGPAGPPGGEQDKATLSQLPRMGCLDKDCDEFLKGRASLGV